MIMQGIYKHYKGGLYHIIGLATHTETKELLVIYKSEDGELYARPEHIFFEKLHINKKVIQRFELIESLI